MVNVTDDINTDTDHTKVRGNEHHLMLIPSTWSTFASVV